MYRHCSDFHNSLINALLLSDYSNQDSHKVHTLRVVLCLLIGNTPLPFGSCHLFGERPGHGLYRIFHILDLSDCISVVVFDVFLSVPWISCSPFVKSRGLIKFKVSFVF